MNPSPTELSDFLSGIFSASSAPEASAIKSYLEKVAASGFNSVPRFELKEIHGALKHMRQRRCENEVGLVTEMLLYASPELLKCLLQMLNGMLDTGSLEPSRQYTRFAIISMPGKISPKLQTGGL